MKTMSNHGTGIVSYDILDLTPSEMDQMIETRELLRKNLINHKSSEKKEYLTDEQLTDIFSIFVRLTDSRQMQTTNSFKTVDLETELNLG